MRRHLRTAVGVVLSLLLLGWALRDVSPGVVLAELRAADPFLFLLAVALATAGFAVRAFRWGILLLPLGLGVPFRARFSATVIGFAVNNILPARVGEFARALALSRISRVPAGASFATLVVERLLDGLAVVALLFASLAAPDFPALGVVAGVDVRSAARLLALAMAVVGVLLLALVLAPPAAVTAVEAILHRALPARLHEPVSGGLRSFLAGLAVLREPRLFLLAAGAALGQWIFTAVSFLVGFRAFGIDEVPFAGAVFLQSLISLAVAIPSSPGFFGPFEAAARVGLGLWGVEQDKAVSFAIGFHLGGFVPVTAMGAYYLWRLGLSWSEVQRSEESVEARLEGAPSRPAGRGSA